MQDPDIDPPIRLQEGYIPERPPKKRRHAALWSIVTIIVLAGLGVAAYFYGLPLLHGYRADTRDTVAAQGASNVASALSKYYDQNGGMPTSLSNFNYTGHNPSVSFAAINTKTPPTTTKTHTVVEIQTCSDGNEARVGYYSHLQRKIIWDNLTTNGQKLNSSSCSTLS